MPKDQTAFRTRDELMAELPHILDAPKDEGLLRLIVVRPEKLQRETPDEIEMTAAGGVAGDHWSKGCWKSLEDGSPHPDVQICMMQARMIEAIAGPDPADWAPAGDNLFIDMDLSPANLPPGTRLALGTVELEMTAEPHNGCDKFIERYGRDACVFVNTGPGKVHRLRGVYAKVVRDGTARVGDRLRKL